MSEIDLSSSSEGVADSVGRVPAEESADGGHDFSTFYRATWNDVTAALALALGSDQLATDAAAEGFARAYERWATVSQMSNPSGWVYRVSLNWARSWIRRRSTERVETRSTRTPARTRRPSSTRLRRACAPGGGRCLPIANLTTGPDDS